MINERDTLKHDEVIKEAKKLIRDHTMYSQEFKVSFRLMEEYVKDHGVVSWLEENGEIIS